MQMIQSLIQLMITSTFDWKNSVVAICRGSGLPPVKGMKPDWEPLVAVTNANNQTTWRDILTVTT